MELEYQGDRGRIAAHTGEIAHAVDYAKVVERVIAIGEGEQYKLLETLAERVASMVFAEFPVSSIHLWVRKVAPPVSHIRGSVGVRMDRTRASTMTEGEPAKFLLEMMPHLPRGNALDVAAGRGRNALYLAESRGTALTQSTGTNGSWQTCCLLLRHGTWRTWPFGLWT